MKNYPLWKSLIVFLVISSGIIFSIPSILYQEDTENWFLENKINLGLDLQGGSYLLLEVQSDVLFKEELENISDSIRLISRNFQIYKMISNTLNADCGSGKIDVVRPYVPEQVNAIPAIVIWSSILNPWLSNVVIVVTPVLLV